MVTCIWLQCEFPVLSCFCCFLQGIQSFGCDLRETCMVSREACRLWPWHVHLSHQETEMQDTMWCPVNPADTWRVACTVLPGSQPQAGAQSLWMVRKGENVLPMKWKALASSGLGIRWASKVSFPSSIRMADQGSPLRSQLCSALRKEYLSQMHEWDGNSALKSLHYKNMIKQWTKSSLKESPWKKVHCDGTRALYATSCSLS